MKWLGPNEYYVWRLEGIIIITHHLFIVMILKWYFNSIIIIWDLQKKLLIRSYFRPLQQKLGTGTKPGIRFQAPQITSEMSGVHKDHWCNGLREGSAYVRVMTFIRNSLILIPKIHNAEFSFVYKQRSPNGTTVWLTA